jgi:hypothetical protein
VAASAERPPEARRDWLLPGAAALFGAALCGLVVSRFGGFFMASDDAYIYLGYARSLLERGELFSYDPGEHSAGSTGLLYYYALCAAGALLRPFYWPDAGRALTLTAFLLASALFVLFALALHRSWRRLSDATGRRALLEEAILFLLAVTSVRFVWGWFSGMENPLTATLVAFILERFLARAPGWQLALLAAALSCSRPELLPFGALLTSLAALSGVTRGGSVSRSSLARALGALLLYAFCAAALTLPSRLLTGQWMPSALGARVEIPALTRPDLLARNFAAAARGGYFWNPWVAGAVALALLAGFSPRAPSRGVLRAASLLLVAYFATRAALGLTDFNVQDRYVSYLWPLYVTVALALVTRVPALRAFHAPGRDIGRLSLALGLAAVTIAGGWALLRAHRELSADILEMNQVVVAPSLWMAQNLPAGSRVAMEPAGAIRVFTDFYLVDNTGLTTGHLAEYLADRGVAGTLGEYLRRNRVDYVFDYPSRAADLRDRDRFALLQLWTPQPRRYSLGPIAVLAVRPE